MKTEQGVSRRDMLAMAAAGGVAIAGMRGAAAQAAKRIERLAPELDAIIATSEPIRELAERLRRRQRPGRRSGVVEGGRLSAVQRHQCQQPR